ncbi:hypothetical protein [Lignipirellula cremea]|uniref:Bacterial type II/III secretion system short domain protein n=1 Tax=Lignipirellula cremea TaxID=2528010 RepID=A0A518DLR0_9BACT|nr:hypothetical protein [Lignipirellula cremea]QDU92769.1 hypothetical protein Pla8534_05180 [Lignipirellula cremea]
MHKLLQAGALAALLMFLATTIEAGETDVDSAHARIQAALNQPFSGDFQQTPLADVVRRIAKQASIPVRLEEEPANLADRPVTFWCHKMTLRHAMGRMLHDLGLVWRLRDGAVVIGPPLATDEEPLSMRMYGVTDLVRDSTEPYPLDRLVEVITQMVDTPSQQLRNLESLRGEQLGDRWMLVVHQTAQGHRETAALLQGIRSVPPANKQAVRRHDPIYYLEGPIEAKLRAALDQPFVEDFFDTTLEQVVRRLSKAHGVNILLDEQALHGIGIGGDVRIRFPLQKLTLRSALNRILADLELTWMIRDEAILLTTPDVVDDHQQPALYDVHDLVTPPPANAFPLLVAPLALPLSVAPQDVKEAMLDFDPLVELITSTVSPDAWPEGTGPSSVLGEEFGGRRLLILEQTDEVHLQIADLLRQLRAALAEGP